MRTFLAALIAVSAITLFSRSCDAQNCSSPSYTQTYNANCSQPKSVSYSTTYSADVCDCTCPQCGCRMNSTQTKGGSATGNAPIVYASAPVVYSSPVYYSDPIYYSSVSYSTPMYSSYYSASPGLGSYMRSRTVTRCRGGSCP